MSLGLRHFSRRKKAGLAHALDLLIYVAAIGAPLALLPQVLQVYRTQDVSSLTLWSWAILGLINLLWVAYGAVHKERPVMLTHAAFCLLNFAMAAAIVLYA